MTPNIRYRIQPRFLRSPLVIVQIHEARNHTASTNGQIEDWQTNGWRDARPEDLCARTPEGVSVI